MICQKVWLGLQPSMSAASSSSLGMVSIKPFMFQMAKGSAPAIMAMPTPVIELRSAGPMTMLSITKSAARVAVLGIISTITKASMPTCRPAKRKRLKA